MRSLEARAQFLTAETYFDEKNYSAAAENFDRVSEFNTTIDFLFDAFMRRIDCMLELDQEDQAIALLEENSTNNKFLNKNSVLRARIGDILKDQGKFIEATEEYEDVLRIYPRTEGSAIAAYGMAQLMEFTYFALDSAKSLYQRVAREYRQSDLIEYAEERSRLLDQYKKIQDTIKRDLDDLEKMQHFEPDSTLEVTEEAGPDKSSDRADINNVQRKPTIRTMEEILASLEKNKFAKG